MILKLKSTNHKKILIITLILFSLIILSGDSLHAKDLGGLDRSQYLKNYSEITIEAGKSMLSDDSNELRRNLVLAGLLSSSFLLDQGVRDFVQDDLYFGDNIISRSLYNLGNPDYILPGYLLAGGYSYLTDNRYFQDSLLLSLQSLIITQFYTSLFKKTVARTRPRNSIDDPFERGEGGKSFFSGHASGSWAVMTVFAERYPDYSLPFYGLAAGVAASRIYEDAHWFSDILTGSLVGYGIGKLTIKMNRNFSEDLQISPIVND
ncbi:MAG: phosphatase PAP2 family protein, partial [Halarsenatibacteraceae bacterium]